MAERDAGTETAILGTFSSSDRIAGLVRPMATITSIASGLWSAAGTWDAGVPIDGDDVVISNGHEITFDVDQSAFTTGVKVTINGTLTHAITGGPYTLFIKTGASVIGSGTWNIGTAANPIPFAVKHTITGAAGWYISSTDLTMNVHAAEPTIKYIKLSAYEAAGQTELSVDTDITGDIWAAGDTIAICNTKANQVEERTIAAGGISADHIDVTVGLTNGKNTGSYIFLLTRNVKIIFVGAPTNCLYDAMTVVSSGGLWYGVYKTLFRNANVSISGGAYYNHSPYFYQARVNVTGGVFVKADWAERESYGVITGGVMAGCNAIFKGYTNWLGGLLVCNYMVIDNSSQQGVIDGVTISDNSNGIFRCPNLNIRNVTFSNNNNNISISVGSGYDCTFSGTEYSSNTSIYDELNNFQLYSASGGLKAWCKGGIVTSQTSVLPPGYVLAYLHTPSSDSQYCFWKKPVTVTAGSTVTITVQLRKSASMAYLPRVYLVERGDNPLLDASEVIDSFTMTDSTDTWESDTFTVTNSTDYDQDYELYFVVKSATGTAYSAVKVSGAGAGSIRNMPIPVFIRRRR